MKAKVTKTPFKVKCCQEQQYFAEMCVLTHNLDLYWMKVMVCFATHKTHLDFVKSPHFKHWIKRIKQWGGGGEGAQIQRHFHSLIKTMHGALNLLLLPGPDCGKISTQSMFLWWGGTTKNHIKPSWDFRLNGLEPGSSQLYEGHSDLGFGFEGTGVRRRVLLVPMNWSGWPIMVEYSAASVEFYGRMSTMTGPRILEKI